MSHAHIAIYTFVMWLYLNLTVFMLTILVCTDVSIIDLWADDVCSSPLY